MRFTPQFLDELRARLPVSEVVGRRVKLKKSGREWKGLSPFQQEKTPSFFVNDQKMAWFDFSSGRNGNIFDFVMATEGLSFPEAVERLAADAGGFACAQAWSWRRRASWRSGRWRPFPRIQWLRRDPRPSPPKARKRQLRLPAMPSSIGRVSTSARASPRFLSNPLPPQWFGTISAIPIPRRFSATSTPTAMWCSRINLGSTLAATR